MANKVNIQRSIVVGVPFNFGISEASKDEFLANEENDRIVVGEDRLIVSVNNRLQKITIPIAFSGRGDKFCLCFRNFKYPGPSYLINEERDRITFAGNRILIRRRIVP